jgi:O-succinylbenzoate synthase
MKLTGAELRRVRLPLAAPFLTALGEQRERESLLVRVFGPDHEGWGECSAMSEPLYTAEYVEGAYDVIRRHLLPRLVAHGHLTPEQVGPALAAVKGHNMAKSALEMAVLDAELRANDVSLARYLGAVRERVEAGVAVGIAGSTAELVATVRNFVDAGYRRVKLKIKPGWDEEPTRAVREAVGDDIMLLVDANGTYGLEDAAHLAKLDDLGLAMIEQPLPPDELLGHAELASRLRTPICLDESITSASSARDAITLGATAIVNVKAGRVGGYLEARKVHDVCTSAGVPVWCGGMLETGLARAANLALAALPGFILPGDLSASERYYQTDITQPMRLRDGHLDVPDGPGIGVEPLGDVLEARTSLVESFP